MPYDFFAADPVADTDADWDTGLLTGIDDALTGATAFLLMLQVFLKGTGATDFKASRGDTAANCIN